MTVQFTVATEKFRGLMSTALLYNSDTLLENVKASISSDGIAIKDLSLEIVSVAIQTSQKFFRSYEVKEPTEVLLTRSLFTIVDKRFKSVEAIEVTIDDKKIWVKSVPTKTMPKGPSYDEDLLAVNEAKFPIALTTTEYGVLPAKAIEKAKVIANVDVAGFLNMPDTREYTFVAAGGDLSLTSTDVGNFSNPIEAKKVIKAEDLRVVFNSGYLDRLTKNLSDDVWITVDDGAINFTKQTDDLSVLLQLSTQEPETQ